MSWEAILPEDDFSLYKSQITLLEEQITHHFPDVYRTPEILSAIRNVPRHLFVSRSYRYVAYTDHALPTHGGLTTSAPSVIAEMVFHSRIQRGQKLLEIGTGTGYEAAVLAEMGVRVFTVEVDRHLARIANRTLVDLGYKLDKTEKNRLKEEEMSRSFREKRRHFPLRGTIELYVGNGQYGLKKQSPYNAVILAASVPNNAHVDPLLPQLSAQAGRLVVPSGGRGDQTLHIIERKNAMYQTFVVPGVTFDFVRLVTRVEAPSLEEPPSP